MDFLSDLYSLYFVCCTPSSRDRGEAYYLFIWQNAIYCIFYDVLGHPPSCCLCRYLILKGGLILFNFSSEKVIKILYFHYQL